MRYRMLTCTSYLENFDTANVEEKCIGDTIGRWAEGQTTISATKWRYYQPALRGEDGTATI
jgi:hypothetical protein